MRNILNKVVEKINNTFSENRAVYEIMSKNLVKAEGTQVTSQLGAHELRAGKARLHARRRIHTPTRPAALMLARLHTHTHTYM